MRNARVAVVGCGALGAPVAIQLLLAGVGRLDLVDYELFDWRNVGRHVLDGQSVGKNKATALARAALRRFPDANVIAHSVRWQTLLQENPSELLKCDLIISCTAHAASNLQMDALIEDGEFPTTVFAWVEPFAFASHAVLRYPSGHGLAVILGTDGQMRVPVVDPLTTPEPSKEPACGALYQPFSSLNAMQGVHLAAELAIDALEGRVSTSRLRTWVGRPDALHSEGLLLTPEWAPRLREHGFMRRYDRVLLPFAS